MRKRKLAVALSLVFGMFGAAAWWSWQGAVAQPTLLGPNMYNLTIGTGASIAAIGANPSRKGITICNGNATAANVITMTVGPTVVPVDGTVGIVIPGGQVAASCFTYPPSGIGGIGNLGAQINLIGHVASIPVTAFEYF